MHKTVDAAEARSCHAEDNDEFGVEVVIWPGAARVQGYAHPLQPGWPGHAV
jgi:hypothetical protein